MADQAAGKKTFFFPALSSRRREIQDPLQPPTVSRASSRAKSLKDSTMRAVLRKVQSQASLYHQKLVDDVASALLEESAPNQQSGPSLQAAPGLTRSPDVLQGPAPVQQSVLPRSGVQNIRPSPGHKRTTAISVKRPSPPVPQKSSRRHRKASLRHRRASSRGSDGPSYTQPSPTSYSSAVNPLRMNPPDLRDLPSMPAGRTTGFRETQPLSGSQDGLAETNEFSKLGHSMSQNALASKPIHHAPRVIKQRGVFRKVTHALADRFYARQQVFSWARSQKGNVKAVIPVTEEMTSEDDAPARGCLHLERDSKAKGSRKTFEDPFLDPSPAVRVPTEFETRLRESSFSSEADQSLNAALPTRNPFETERVLESSIDAFLPSPPLASSTPRARHERFEVISDSPTKRSRDPLAADSIGASLCADPPSPQKPVGGSSGESSSRALQPTSHNRAGVTNPRGRSRLSYLPVVASQDHKKHPSPNKSDLELLENRFRKQFPNLILASPDENDEKVELDEYLSSPSSANPLALEDDNRPHDIAPSQATSNLPKAASRDNSSPLGPRHRRHWSDSHPSRPAAPIRSRVQARVAMYGHLRSNSLEADELQWDMRASSLGMNAVC